MVRKLVSFVFIALMLGSIFLATLPAGNAMDPCIPEAPDPAEVQNQWDFVLNYYREHTQRDAGSMPIGVLTNIVIHLPFTRILSGSI